MDLYLWVKALHVISIITWMAAILYLPRLYVYHAQAEDGLDKSETFKVMERRLLRAIGNPSMIAAFGFGIWLIFLVGAGGLGGWFHVKLLCVIGIAVCHMLFAKWRKDFEADRNTRSHTFYRVWNEVPTVLMLIVVVLAVVKPF